jgi:hypothetical protein
MWRSLSEGKDTLGPSESRSWGLCSSQLLRGEAIFRLAPGDCQAIDPSKRTLSRKGRVCGAISRYSHRNVEVR